MRKILTITLLVSILNVTNISIADVASWGAWVSSHKAEKAAREALNRANSSQSKCPCSIKISTSRTDMVIKYDAIMCVEFDTFVPSRIRIYTWTSKCYSIECRHNCSQVYKDILQQLDRCEEHCR